MPLRSMTMGEGVDGLTAEVGHGVQLGPPVIGDDDGLLLDALVAFEPELVGVLDHLGHALRVYGVEDVEEVLAVDALALGRLVGHVLHDLGVRGEAGPQVGDGQLVEPGDLDELDVGDLEELLLAGQDLAEEAAVHRGFLENVELQMLLEIAKEAMGVSGDTTGPTPISSQIYWPIPRGARSWWS